MALEKQSLNNFLPDGFETEDKDGYKTNFSDDKISTGFQKDVADILSGPNLNNLIDKVGKNTNTTNNYIEYLNNMDINKTPIVDNNNNLNYTQIGLKKYSNNETYLLNDLVSDFIDEEVKIYRSLINNNQGNPLENDSYWQEVKLGGGSLPIGAVFPLTCSSAYVPSGALPCDGAEYSKSQFTDLWNNYLSTSLLNTCTYTEYTSDISTYGQCGKFAVDTANNKFRVPLIKDGTVIQQALTNSELGKSYNAGLPNITGKVVSDYSSNWKGAFYDGGTINGEGGSGKDSLAIFDASRSNPIYGNSTTVQPNAVALRYFVVVANGQINQSMMDWSAWASSLQGKSNTDLSNLSDSGKKVIDGQWVAKSATLSTSTAVGTYTIDLSNYLPKDNYNYEVQLTNLISRNAKNVGRITMYIKTSLMNKAYLCCTGGNCTPNVCLSNIPVGLDRKLNIEWTEHSLGENNLKVVAYRRIGTNQ